MNCVSYNTDKNCEVPCETNFFKLFITKNPPGGGLKIKCFPEECIFFPYSALSAISEADQNN